MKTLVVLSVFATVALAAPSSLFEQEGFKKIHANAPEIFKRERKSTQDTSISENQASVAPVNLPSSSHISEFGVTGRTFGLKKPIIIKKKPVGYQVYRASDEVPADSEESCGSHVKVKFCDGKTKMKSTTVEDSDNTQMMEEDMKHSITLAKEALENVQRDLKNVERKPGTQAGSWNHGHSESDAELHQDIEVAREALEHIHKNFENLESTSLHESTLKNADNAPKASFALAKTEEQRLAQWKEAIDTIQKNVEIARNIEDSFRESSGEPGLVSDATMATNNIIEKDTKIDHNLRTSEDGLPKNENKDKSCKVEKTQEKSSEKENKSDAITEIDMASSASTMSEKKLKDFQDTEKARHTSGLLSEPKAEALLTNEQSLEISPKESETDDNTMVLHDMPTVNSIMSDSMKAAEGKKEEKNKHFEPESTNSEHTPAIEMKSVETEDLLVEDQKKAAETTEKLEKIGTEKEIHPSMKSAELIEDKSKNKNKGETKEHADLLTEPSEKIESTLFTKFAKEASSNTQKELQVQPKELDHLAEGKMGSNEDMNQQHEELAPINHNEQMQLAQVKQPFFHPEMRAAEEMNTMHQHQLNPETRWAHGKSMNMEPMTSSDDIHSHKIDHVHTVHHPGHRHHIAHGMNNHQFEKPTGHEQLHSRYSNNFMAQEKSADTDMQAYYMSMRDGSVMGPESQRFRWKPTHERTAYGAPAAPAAAPASGAVGVFPNANLGGCGIPLLLSCNPSVVSGSLAKPSPAYSAPAYRSEDEFNFLTKRELKKALETSNLHRSPKANPKTGTVLVAKQ